MKADIVGLFNEFLYEMEFIKKSKRETLRNYAHVFTLFHRLKPEITLDTLTTMAVIDFFKILQERKRPIGRGIVKVGVKKSTVATYWTKLNAFFKWLHAKDYILSNPFFHLPYPTPSYEDRKFLTKTEIEKIITAIYTHHSNNILILKRNLVIFYILLFCGLRREELMQLQVRDLDFEKKLLIVRAETSKVARERQIPLHSTVIFHLKDYLNSRKKYTTSYLIVSAERDHKLTLEGVKHIIQKLRRFSGISFHLHQFRHTFAVNFLKSSNNIAKLKQLLGHKSIAMTLTYLRCLPADELREDIECMSIDNFI